MSELQKLRIIIGYEFLKHIRRKRLWVILGLTLITELAVIIILPLLMDGFPDNVLVMAAMLTVGPSLATIGAVFFAGDSIAGEFESKTGFMLFTNPVKRTTFIIGKYLACYIAVAALIIFGYIIMCITLMVIYGEIPPETAQSFGLALLFGGSVLSVTFLASSLSKGSMGATVFTLVFIMVISGIIDGVLMMAGEPHWFMISTNGDAIATVYGGYELFMEGMVPHDMPFGLPETPDIGLNVLSMCIYLVVGFAGSLFFSRRRQLS